jgi:hydrogenase expression/formation protein HypE
LALTGKERPGFMKRVVYANLGRPSRRVVVGPGWGLDNGVVSVGRKQVMIVTVDPMSVIPEFSLDLSAWTSVHHIASDYATSGARPEFATFSYNFPPSMKESEKRDYLVGVGRECGRLGVSIVGGHTGSYPGGNYTIVGTGSMLGFCDADRYVSPKMAQRGDSILLTKHAAIEAAASLAICFASFAEKRIGTRMAKKARNMIRLATTVNDALAAAGVGLGKDGVTSMHDATEGGVLGGLDEMAKASKHRFDIALERVVVSPEAREVCRAFGIDPLTSLGEGALIITCRPGAAARLRRVLEESHIQVRQIGTVESGSGLWISKAGNPPVRFRTRPDPYWEAYARSSALGLK